MKERHGSHAAFARTRFRIRRDHILEDAFNQLSTLSEEDLRGLVMIIILMYALIFSFVALKYVACSIRLLSHVRVYMFLRSNNFLLCRGLINSFTVVCIQIRVTFVNEFGVEEAGIDGGGIFKDFMENITRAAFDVQYGLFKVSNLPTPY